MPQNIFFILIKCLYLNIVKLKQGTMETKYTKGLRMLYPSINEPNVFPIVDSDGLAYAQVFGANGTPEEMDEAEANAKLFVAAEDLLQFAIEMVERYPNSPWIYEQGNKAIEKATK